MPSEQAKLWKWLDKSRRKNSSGSARISEGLWTVGFCADKPDKKHYSKSGSEIMEKKSNPATTATF